MTSLSVFGQTVSTFERGKVSKLESPRQTSSTIGCNDGWDKTFTTNGADGLVEVVTSDGAGGFYVAGSFTSINGVPAVGIARWDGTTWSALGSGIYDWVRSIAVSGSDVYVGGRFTSAGGVAAHNIAKWDGTSWTALGPGIGNTTAQSSVTAIAVSGNDVYAGGDFGVNGGAIANNIAKWDGSAWSPLGTGGNGTINVLTFNNGLLYAGGLFSMVGGVSAFGVATWDGTSWASVGTLSINTKVVDIAFSGTDLYVAGDNVIVNGQGTSVAKWDGTTWTRLGFFGSSVIRTITVLGTDVYVGGGLPFPSNVFNHIAKWNGSVWSGLGTGIEGGSQPVYDLAVAGNKLVIVGDFHTAGGIGAKNIATYSAGTWGAFPGTGVDSEARAIAVSGTDVYVGGSFASAGPVTANRIAKWNGLTNTWSPLGTGVAGSNSTIWAIAVAGNKVYAGGSFGTIGGNSASNIAVWDGNGWSPLGTGVNGTVRAITIVGEDVYVGGSFQFAGGVAVNRIAKWNGTTWNSLNSGIITNDVTAIAASGNDIYVGAGYTTLDGPNYFLKYDGIDLDSAWHRNDKRRCNLDRCFRF